MSFKFDTRIVMDGKDRAVNKKLISLMRKYKKGKTLDEFESRIDIICLEIAQECNLVYERDGDMLKFSSKGLNYGPQNS